MMTIYIIYSFMLQLLIYSQIYINFMIHQKRTILFLRTIIFLMSNVYMVGLPVQSSLSLILLLYEINFCLSVPEPTAKELIVYQYQFYCYTNLIFLSELVFCLTYSFLKRRCIQTTLNILNKKAYIRSFTTLNHAVDLKIEKIV